MTRLQLHPHPEQHALLAAYATSSPKSARRPRAGIAAEVLLGLRAEDAITGEFASVRAALMAPMHDPAELPMLPELAALIEESERERGSRNAALRAVFAEDRVRRERIAAASWVDDAAATVMTECAAEVLDAVAARPWARDDAALRMSLAPIVSWLKLTQPLPVTDWTAQLADAFAESEA